MAVAASRDFSSALMDCQSAENGGFCRSGDVFMGDTIACAIVPVNSKREFYFAIARGIVGRMDIRPKRVLRLRVLVEQFDSIAAFARHHGLDATYISQLLNGHRQFGEKAARTMESKMNLPANYFDVGPGEDRTVAPTDEEWRSFTNEELAEIAQAVLSELSRRAGN